MQGVSLTPQETSRALKSLVAGETGRSIANELGVNEDTISRLKNRKESREFIERESQRMLQALPDLTDQTIRDFKLANSISKYLSGQEVDIQDTLSKLETVRTDKNGQVIRTDSVDGMLKLYEMISRRGDKYLQAVGILPSMTQSVFIQNIYNDNRSQIISPMVLGALGKHLEWQFEEDESENEIPQDVGS